MLHHLPIYPDLKKTLLPHPLPMHQIKREVEMNVKQVTMRIQMKMREKVIINQAIMMKQALKKNKMKMRKMMDKATKLMMK